VYLFIHYFTASFDQNLRQVKIVKKDCVANVLSSSELLQAALEEKHYDKDVMFQKWQK